jgi:hypothetical protein
MNQNVDIKNKEIVHTVSMERRDELINIARRSRIKWIMNNSISNNNNNSNNKVSLINDDHEILNKKIPASECIIKVLDLLNNIVDDGDQINIDSLIIELPNEEDNDDESIFENDSNVNSLMISKQDNESSYLLFLARLRQTLACEIVKSMQKFISKFEITIQENKIKNINNLDIIGIENDHEINKRKEVEEITNNELNKDEIELDNSIWEFIEILELEMRLCKLWKNESESEWNNTKLMCEKFIFIKLHLSIFFISKFSYHDQRLKERIQSLSFITPEHLDIKAIIGTSVLEEPINILSTGLCKAYSPIDKMYCIKSCFMKINEELKNLKNVVAGTDEFLPILILVLAKSNPPYLHSTVKYLERYLSPKLLGIYLSIFI